MRILVLCTKYAVKVDSFVTEANVHFPTDYNLLCDSGRKCLDVLEHLMDTNVSYCTGWRKIENWRKNLKNKMLIVSNATADTCAMRSVAREKIAVFVCARQQKIICQWLVSYTIKCVMSNS